MKKYIIVSLIGMIFISCSNDDNSNESFLVVYNQTYCADPWGYADNNDELANKVIAYLKAENIVISLVKFDSKGTPQLCNACNCLSGERIITMVSEDDLNAIEQFGFQEFE